MTRRLESHSSIAQDVSDAAIQALLDRGEFFWLDLEQPTDDDKTLIRDTLGITGVSHGGFDHVGRRPSFDDYDDFDLVTVYGAAEVEPSGMDRLVEVHCLVSERFLVTLHDQPSPALDDAVGECAHGHDQPASPAEALHRVVDLMVESLLPIIGELDARGDELADAVLENPAADIQREILQTRRRVIALRRVAIPQRDMLGRLSDAQETDVPGMTRDVSRRFRSDYERMVRVVDALDGARDAAQAATDVYLGTVNNRLNVVMKQLTVLAGIFLPLTFLTGYFGQNFGWMVDHVGSGWAFVLLGLVLPVVLVLALLQYFRQQHWL